MTTGKSPRRKPPWWPENEEWPPRDGHGPWRWHGASGGPWRRGRGGRRPPFGCMVIGFLLFAAATLTAGVWALAALVGLVSAPPIVLVGGLVVTILVALGAAATFRVIRGTSASIDRLSAAAEQIERGDYATRVDETGPPQVRTLARAFNQMSARLADVDSGRRTFLADVAHELRTPLTVIKGQLEAIEDGIYPADAEHLAPIHDQIRALEKLIDDMRTVALAESGSLTLELRPTDLREVADDTLAAFQPQAAAGGVSLMAEIPSGLPMAMVDEQRVRQVLVNLVANALRYTSAGGSVAVNAKSAGSSWIAVEVADDGAGMPVELIGQAFDRFVKSADSPGSGLGLAICRDVVEAHGGTISIASAEDRGTTVTFTLPAVESGG